MDTGSSVVELLALSAWQRIVGNGTGSPAVQDGKNMPITWQTMHNLVYSEYREHAQDEHK